MLPTNRSLLLRGLLGAGLAATTLVAAAPGTAQAVPQPAAALAAAPASLADYDQKLAAATKFGCAFAKYLYQCYRLNLLPGYSFRCEWDFWKPATRRPVGSRGAVPCLGPPFPGATT